MSTYLSQHRRDGFLIFDALASLAVVATLLVLLGVIVGQHRRADQNLGDQRAAVRRAEQALLDLQLGRPLAADVTHPRAVLTVTPLDDAAPMADRVWVEVHSQVRTRSVTLIGLAPREHVPPPGAPAAGAEEVQP